MENVVLIVHLILALCLIGVVLLQRSEGGGLGLGGGGGGGGLVSARGAATALGKVTWLFAIGFICTAFRAAARRRNCLSFQQVTRCFHQSLVAAQAAISTFHGPTNHKTSQLFPR